MLARGMGKIKPLFFRWDFDSTVRDFHCNSAFRAGKYINFTHGGIELVPGDAERRSRERTRDLRRDVRGELPDPHGVPRDRGQRGRQKKPDVSGGMDRHIGPSLASIARLRRAELPSCGPATIEYLTILAGASDVQNWGAFCGLAFQRKTSHSASHPA